MGSQEAYNTLFKYFGQNDTNTVHYLGDNKAVIACGNALANSQVVFDDAPDMYLVDNDTVYIIEHFEFDCFKRTKKGSAYRRREAIIDKEFDKIEPSEEGITFHAVIQEESSYKFFLDNIKTYFDYHYNRIPNYIENLKNKGIIRKNDRVKIIFFIEDVSPLGTIVFDRKRGSMEPVILASSKEFLEYYKSKPNVDYIISCSQCEKYDYIWFIDRNQIEEYFNNTRDYSKMEFLNFEPNEIRFKMIIPNKL